MDKMGESEKAGTKGIPGTPRDGAPIEIVGLVKSTLRWLDGLVRGGMFPFEGVVASSEWLSATFVWALLTQETVDGMDRLVTYGEWNDLIQRSFERYFYVPLGNESDCCPALRVLMHAIDPADDSQYAVDTELIHRRGIYKDVYGSGRGREWSDYQFRPNFPIAMTVAPELFDEIHALQALRLADQILRGPMGMKTLDPTDMQYRPHYDNSNDSEDRAIAKGLNYHNVCASILVSGLC